MTIDSLRRIERMNYLLGGALVVLMVFVMPPRGALGVLVGALLSGINFTVMRRIAQGWTSRPPEQRAASSVFMLPKMMLLMLAVVLALTFLPISAIGLATGFSVFLVSIAVETVRYISSPAPAGDPLTGDPSTGGANDAKK